MNAPVAGPSNRYLLPQRDRRWPHVLSLALLVATVVLVALLLVGWPRLKSTSIHYELGRLREDIEQLERRQRQLRLELEAERHPVLLAEKARALGLEAPTTDDLQRLVVEASQ